MKILVGVDLSESMEEVLRETETLAKALAAKIWVLHITEPEPDFVGFDPGPKSVRKSLSDKFHQEHKELQAIAEEFRAAGIDATALLIQGPTVERLIGQAEKLEVDIIIIGSHRRGSLYQFFVGSVESSLLHAAKCSVLVVPTRSSN